MRDNVVHLPVVKERSCGECSVCCDYVSIAELDKPARIPCHLLVGEGRGCSVHGVSQPKVCVAFECSWKRGIGDVADRPDKIGGMFLVNKLEGQLFGLGLELWPGAMQTSAASMLATVASATLLPVIVSDYESLPPNDKGDRVAAHHSILYRARRMVGPLIEWISPDVALHVLVKGG